MSEQFQRDDDGNIIDPPVIPEQERAVSDAAASGDTDAVAAAQEDYNAAREDLVSDMESESDSGSEDASPVSESGAGEDVNPATGTGDAVDETPSSDDDSVSASNLGGSAQDGTPVDSGNTDAKDQPENPGGDPAAQMGPNAPGDQGSNPGGNNPAVGNLGQQGASDSGATGTVND